ncbi:unnamed protein product, partial [Timema podura]|nr:unnamed protein product [Timema podura]
PQSYEDAGDDSIVPSTPTLFVPRRSDGFGEAVSSPQVPQGRFIFSETNPPTARAGVAQVASEGMDDTRIDLSQMDEQGTGRSVPTTPLQASPQGEVGQSMESDRDQTEDTQVSHTDDGSVPSGIPSITITQDPDDQPSLQLGTH